MSSEQYPQDITDDESDPSVETTQPDDVFDKAAAGDKHSITVLALAVGFYATIAVVSCVGKYLATKWAVKSALRDMQH